MNKLSRLACLSFILGLTLAACAAKVQAQSFCASDGVPRPVALVERFINADCEACWSEPGTTQPTRGELALDWIVPGSQGDKAPLAAAASRDARPRLQSLGLSIPAQTQSVRRRTSRSAHTLRVAHGLPFNGYIGASMELRPGRGGPWKAWLLLVETIPAGTEGSPVERNLVRNVLQPAWEHPARPSPGAQQRLFELRSMNVPEGARPERLRLVGWVEDERGRIRAIAQSRCPQTGAKG